jgi:hypothetical protein
MMSTFKQNVVKKSNWLSWCGTQNVSDLDATPSWNCTVTVNGEKISYIKGDLTISGCTFNVCNVTWKRTFIVKDGSTYIKSNINTFGNANARLLLGTITDGWILQTPIPSGNNPNMSRSSFSWWLLIHPDVTNIDAFLLSQGPMISYDWTKVFNAPTSSDLLNQLHIYGSVITLNTIGWYKSLSDSKCPYIIPSCTQKTAFMFDLTTLRRYSLIQKGFGLNSGLAIVAWGWKRSWQNTSDLNISSSDNKISTWDNSSPSWIRYISDADYIIYPVFIQKDPSWNTNTSIFFRTDK